jgi:hypothetical protein
VVCNKYSSRRHLCCACVHSSDIIDARRMPLVNRGSVIARYLQSNARMCCTTRGECKARRCLIAGRRATSPHSIASLTGSCLIPLAFGRARRSDRCFLLAAPLPRQHFVVLDHVRRQDLRDGFVPQRAGC